MVVFPALRIVIVPAVLSTVATFVLLLTYVKDPLEFERGGISGNVTGLVEGIGIKYSPGPKIGP